MSVGQGMLMALLITGGTALILAGVGLPFLIRSRDARRLLATGLPAQAVVETMSDTGLTVNGRPVVAFDLTVSVPGTPPYPLSHRQSLPRIPPDRVAPGAVLPVRVDPARHDRLRIDWPT
ncbi:hypothetical protein GCM10012278_33520 [Nonomuraea glycinis]|uniref:Uncharacterized protein n=2 Tax=Nonomuraea glycinis TaxID=2047744 RepID=A0A918A6X9_9ACTN|nr:hypothetical protein GCM10012278_33520 [Nonomuraea glycinis]